MVYFSSAGASHFVTQADKNREEEKSALVGSPTTESRETALGELALARKLISPEQLKECLREIAEARARGETLHLGQMLLRRRLIDSDGLTQLLQENRRQEVSLPRSNRYEIREKLGEGATAAVYRAWDRTLNRPVALKILKSFKGTQESVRHRFLREARVAAGLSHQNLVAVYDVGEVNGQLYLVMELVEGRSFGEVLRSPTRDLSAILLLIEKIARGVGLAHEQGIVHRDLKPANMLVTHSGTPKVSDFGLAHLLDSQTALTDTGDALGTPLYMSPEQVRAEPEGITPRTDVYSLGAVLYEVLTGRPPHVADTVAGLYAKILAEEPVAPGKLDPKIPRDLETVCFKALDKDPKRRYANATELAEDLRRFREHEPVLAKPAGGFTRASKWVRRHHAMTTAAALILSGLAVFLVVQRVRASQLSDKIQTLLERAAAAERDGRLAEAGELYVEVRTLRPGHPVAEEKLRAIRAAGAGTAAPERRWRLVRRPLSAAFSDDETGALFLSDGPVQARFSRRSAVPASFRKIGRPELEGLLDRLQISVKARSLVARLAAEADDILLAGGATDELSFYLLGQERADVLVYAPAPSALVYALELDEPTHRLTLAPDGYLEIRNPANLAWLRLSRPIIFTGHGEERGTMSVDGALPAPPEVIAIAPSSSVDVSIQVESSDSQPVLIATTWTTTASMAVGREHPAAASLEDDRVLIVGGQADAALGSSEIFDPVTQTWTSTGSLPPGEERLAAPVVSLPGGKVFLCGGYDPRLETAFDTAFIWHPAGFGAWKRTHIFMSQGRAFHKAARLADGRILIAGGASIVRNGEAVNPLSSCYLYIPSLDELVSAVSLPRPLARFDMLRLDDNTVLLAGGIASDASGTPGVTDECFIYVPDAASGRWISAARLPVPRKDLSLTRLPGGPILLTGGGADCSLFISGAWSPAASVPEAPLTSSWTVLIPHANGALLQAAAGGRSYRCADGRWSGPYALKRVRDGAAACAIGNGMILVAGGRSEQEIHSTSEIYEDAVGGNAPPAVPAELEQRIAQTSLADAAQTRERRLTFLGTLSDPNGDLVRLQVEIKPVTASFDGSELLTSRSVLSGQFATSVAASLSPGSSYHWRARALDDKDAASAWVEYEEAGFEIEDVTVSGANASDPALTDETFERWRALLLPSEDEMRWRRIPWRPTLWEGVVEAHEKEAPILLWTTIGHPLGTGDENAIRARRDVWSDPDVIALAKPFIPCGESVTQLHRREGPEGEFFGKFKGKGHSGGSLSKLPEGIYAVAPSGELLASIESDDPRQVERTLRKALAAWEALPSDKRRSPEPPPPDPGKLWRQKQRFQEYPADGLVLRVVARDLPRDKPAGDRFAGMWNLDYAWLQKADALKFLPVDLRVGFKQQVPLPLIQRLAQFHLLDIVRGETVDFPIPCIQDAQLSTEVTSLDGDLVSIRLEGRTRTSQEGKWAVKTPAPLERLVRQQRGYQARLLGRATYDRVGERFIAFELVAVGVRWGGTRYNNREDDLDQSPMGLVFTLAGVEAADRTAPKFREELGY
ncbi:MAG: protein kinase [Planctomycetes bacterium]|nr:protein kinase [Planctomycetota bacterium]